MQTGPAGLPRAFVKGDTPLFSSMEAAFQQNLDEKRAWPLRNLSTHRLCFLQKPLLLPSLKVCPMAFRILCIPRLAHQGSKILHVSAEAFHFSADAGGLKLHVG